MTNGGALPGSLSLGLGNLAGSQQVTRHLHSLPELGPSNRETLPLDLHCTYLKRA